MQFWAFLDLKLRHYCSWDWVATTCQHKLSPKSCHPPKFNLFVFQNLDFTNLTFLRLGWFLAAGGLQRQVPQLINPKLLSYHGTATPPAALLAIWSKPGPKCDTLSTNLTRPMLIWPVHCSVLGAETNLTNIKLWSCRQAYHWLQRPCCLFWNCHQFYTFSCSA